MHVISMFIGSILRYRQKYETLLVRWTEFNGPIASNHQLLISGAGVLECDDLMTGTVTWLIEAAQLKKKTIFI